MKNFIMVCGLPDMKKNITVDDLKLETTQFLIKRRVM